MRFSDSYEVPNDVLARGASPEYREFLRNWFADPRAVIDHELDLSFVRRIPADELARARELIRDNLKVGHTHIVEGAAVLGDVAAVPILRDMLNFESNPSRRLTIAGALWMLVQDPAFLSCLNESKSSVGRLFTGHHLYQILWLDDERALDFLVDLSGHNDHFVRYSVLSLLNQLESGEPFRLPERLEHGAEFYRRRQRDDGFRRTMVASIRRWNRAHADSTSFRFEGWE